MFLKLKKKKKNTHTHTHGMLLFSANSFIVFPNVTYKQKCIIVSYYCLIFFFKTPFSSNVDHPKSKKYPIAPTMFVPHRVTTLNYKCLVKSFVNFKPLCNFEPFDPKTQNKIFFSKKSGAVTT